MKKYILDMVVKSIEHYANGYALLKMGMASPSEALPTVAPGQFVQIRIDETPEVMLRRPVSINFVDYDAGELWLLVHGIGAGTKWIISRKPQNTLNVILPLGNGFTMPAPTHQSTSSDGTEHPMLLVGGGVGIAPLLYLAKALQEQGHKVYALLGARSANDILQRELFERYATVCITTEDGSLGQKGLVTQHTIWDEQLFAEVFTCGPKPMMRAVAQLAQTKQLACQASLENMMACGLGACLCCVQDTTQGHLCVCQDGPVFDTQLIKW